MISTRNRYYLIVVLILAVQSLLVAQTLDWQELKLDGENTRIWYTAANNDGSILAASCVSGVFITKNGGYGWSKVRTSGGAIALSSDGNTVLAGGSALILSTNGGSSWTSLNPTDNTWTLSDAIALSGNGNVIAAEFVRYSTGEQGKYFSFDKGVTWRKSNPPKSGYVLATTISVNNDGSKILVATVDTVFISVDSAKSWTIINIPSTRINVSWKTEMSSDGVHVLLWDERELYVSHDGGASWNLRWSNTNPYSSAVLKVADISDDGQTIIAGGGNILIYSTDGGVNWTEQTPYGSSSYLWKSVAISANGAKVLAGTILGYVYIAGLTPPQTLPWSTSIPSSSSPGWGAVAVNSNFNKILVGNGQTKFGRLYYTVNGGTSWSEVRPAGDTNYTWTNVAMNADGSRIFVLSSQYGGGLFLSTDNGNSWSDLRPDGSASRQWWYTIALSAEGSIVFAGCSNLYKSTNGGVTWEQVPLSSGAKYFDKSAITPDGSKVIVGGTWGKLLYSADSGNTWNEITVTGITQKTWQSIAMSDDGTKILLSAGGKLLYSTDSGGTWSELYPLGFSVSGNSVAMSGDGRVMVVAEYNGLLYLSTNSGSTWSIISPQPIVNSSWSMVRCNREGTKVIAVSGSDGKVYISDIVVGVEHDQLSIPTEITLYQNYPNPFNPSTTIRYSLPQAGNVKLTVYDFLGREVATLVDEWKSAGDHSVQFNANHLSSGVYFYKLSTSTGSTMKKMLLLK